MEIQNNLFEEDLTYFKQSKITDKVYTPEYLVKKILKELPIKHQDSLYDAFAGGKVFYKNFPKGNKKYWTEIEEGKDFFDFKDKVDWIISNPPYSIYVNVMKHSFEIAKNIVYLIPLTKLTASFGRITDVDNFGGIRKLWIFPASKANFPFGFPACFVWMQKGYKGNIETELWKDL